MSRPVREELRDADRALRRYVRHLFAEARKLGYPTASSFAKGIAAGTVALPPPTPDDPELDSIAKFWSSRLSQLERSVCTAFYEHGDSPQEAARKAGIPVRAVKDVLRDVRNRACGWLSAEDDAEKVVGF